MTNNGSNDVIFVCFQNCSKTKDNIIYILIITTTYLKGSLCRSSKGSSKYLSTSTMEAALGFVMRARHPDTLLSNSAQMFTEGSDADADADEVDASVVICEEDDGSTTRAARSYKQSRAF